MISEQFPWLTTIVLFPFLASLPIPLLPGQNNKAIRSYALAVGLAEFALILYTFSRYFSLQEPGLQLIESYRWIPQIGLNWTLAADGLSMPLVVLSGLVTTLAILASWNISLKPRLL
jgi:NAD(P)H-quinone oxidoreductase subunit 4